MKTLKADPLELAYLAGVVDSDGCITIYRNTSYQRLAKTTKGAIYQPRVTIGQVQPQAVQLAMEIFGGKIHPKYKTRGNARQLLVWRAESGRAYEVLEMLLPYLRIKKAQAENALKLKGLRWQKNWERLSVVDGEPLITGTEFAKMLGFKPQTILQGCRTGAIPSVPRGKYRMVPVSFAPIYAKRREQGGHPHRPDDVTNTMEEIYARGKELNRVGRDPQVTPPSHSALAGCER